jgi:transposase
MGEVVTVGLDIAKSVFQVHGVDVEGRVVVQRKLARAKLLPFFEKLPPCLLGRVTASQIASASAASFFCHFRYGFTYEGGISFTS